MIPVRLKKGREEQVHLGMPWVLHADLVESSEHLLALPGSLCTVESARGEFIGIGTLNVQSPIACRVLTLKREPVDAAFFRARLTRALAMREATIGGAHYRLVHAEADGLPGLLLDRFGDIMVAQVGTAGMELLRPQWMEALQEVIKPTAVIFRNDTAARSLEGLGQTVEMVGEVAQPVDVVENGFTYRADLARGQKTGWFYDQRDNRRMIADLAHGKTLLDVYAHSGGFGLLAAKAGAEATLVDSSAFALSLAKEAAERNSVSVEVMQGDAFEVMGGLSKRYDIVLADPPAFVKSRKDIAAGMKGYEKVARLAAARVESGGLLFIASCSHHASRGAFEKAVLAGVGKAGREAEVLRRTGAAADHPRHPQLPQSEYLKGLLLRLA